MHLLTCKCYGKQYVGEITDEFRDLDGVITQAMIGKLHGIKHACKNICLSILKAKVIVVFF